LKIRAVAFAVLAAVLAVFLVLSWQAWDSRRRPAAVSRGGAAGPPGTDLHAAAELRIERALEVLSDPEVDPASRIASYREELRVAEGLLVRSLAQSPAQARALAALAAVRWELSPPTSADAARDHLALIEQASRMAPRVPFIQQRLGELLLRMGRRKQGLDYLGRALELAPDRAVEIVAVLRRRGYSAVDALRALPRGPELLTAVARPLIREGRSDALIEAVEAHAGPWTVELLIEYGSACLDSAQPERLAAHMDALEESGDPLLDAERLMQRATARIALGEAGPALADARAARALQPSHYRFSDGLARVALGAGDLDLAETSFRESLRELAAANASAERRARTHSELGRIEDRRGRPDRAYDSYRRALDLDPDEPLAKRRIEEMRSAAGSG
jgi:tetratricopeptide (TPR) repeat protein